MEVLKSARFEGTGIGTTPIQPREGGGEGWWKMKRKHKQVLEQGWPFTLKDFRMKMRSSLSNLKPQR